MSSWEFFKKEKTETPAIQTKKGKIDFEKLPSLLTLEQVSEILRVHPNTLRNWDANGKLKAVRIGPRKDRRYDKQAVHILFKKLLGAEAKANLRPAKPTPKLQEKSYIIKPSLSWRNLRLFLISKKFSVFVYSVAVVGFAFLTIQVTFFAYMYIARAENQPLDTFAYTIEPATVTGWDKADQAKHIDLLGSAVTGDFTENNSAIFQNTPLIAKPGEVTTSPAINVQNNKLEASGFTIPADLPQFGIIKKADLTLSLGTDSFKGNEDVLSISYSIDNGVNWTDSESFALDGSSSNATHGGLWTYALTPQQGFSIDAIDKLRVKVTYNPTAGAELAAAYLDGISLSLNIQEPPSAVNQIEESVTLTKEDFKLDELPKIDVQVKDAKILGLGNEQRTVQDVTITDPEGEEVSTAFYTKKDVKSGNDITTEYVVDTPQLKKPGVYHVVMQIEQDGETKTVVRDFSWGVLVVNTMKSVYTPGETVHTGMGVLDSGGNTLCDAELVLNIVSPDKKTATLSTKNSTITRSKECGPNTVTNVPDYAADFTAEVIGDYQLTLTATTAAGDYTINETVHVQPQVAFNITRLGPTRIWPGANYEMFLEVVPAANYQGQITETVPDTFQVTRVDNGGQASEAAGGVKTITWQVDWEAGKEYTLSYEMDPPNISPELFQLGPAKLGSFTELRRWQIASDAACNASTTGNWSVGGNWTGCSGTGGVPASTDTITINTGVTITVDANATVAGITLGGVAGANGISINSGITLTNSGATTINAQTDVTNATLAVGAGIFSTTTLNIAGSSTSSQNSIFSISTGSATLSSGLACSGTAAQAQFTFTGAGTVTVSGGNFGSGCTFTRSTGNVKFTGSGSQTIAQPYQYYNVEIAGSGTVSTVIGGTTTISGTLTVTSGTFTMVNAAVTVTGATSVSGTVNSGTAGTGSKSFNGGVTINSGGVWDLSAVNPSTAYGSANGITMNGTTFNNGTGSVVFRTAGPQPITANAPMTFGGAASTTVSMSFAGSSAITFSSTFAINGAYTVTNNNTGGVTITSNLTGSTGAVWSNGAATANSLAKFGGAVLATGTLTPSTANANTIEYTGAGQTIKSPSANYYHLTLSGSGTPVLPGAMTINGNFTTSGTVTPSLAGNTAVTGILTVGTGTNLTVGSTYTFSVNSTTSITGTLTISSTSGAKTFTGAVTVNDTGTWTNSGNCPVTFQGGLTNNSANTFTAGSGIYTFDTNSQAIGGTYAISIPSVTVTTVTLTNNGTLTVTTALDGTGGLTNAASQTLNINFTGAVGITTLTASASGNTVNYGYGGTQTVKAVTYHHLTLSTSGEKTLTSVTTLNGNLTLSGTATATISSVMAIAGDISVGTGTTLTIGANTTVNGGDIAVTSTGSIAYSGTPTLTMGATGAVSGNGNISIYTLATSGTGTTTYSASGTNAINNNITVGAGTTLDIQSSLTTTGNITTTTTGIISSSTGTPTVTMNGSGTLGGGAGAITFYNLTLGGSPTFGSSFTVKNNLTLPASVTAGSTTVTMTGTAGTLVGGGATVFNLTINPSSAGTITLDTSNLTVSGTLNVASGDILSIASGITLTQTGNNEISGTGTISGAGTLTFTNTSAGPGTTLTTLSSLVRFDATNGDIASTAFDARTYGSQVQLYSSSASARVITMASGTYTSTYFYVYADGDGSTTVTGLTNYPTVNCTRLDFMGTGAGSETIISGTGTWSASSITNFTGGTYTATTGNTLRFNGGSNFTSASNALYNMEVAGSVTMLDALTVSNDLTMTSGTLFDTSSALAVNGGDITCGASTCGAFSMSGTATVTLSGTGNFGTAGLSPNWSFINLTFSGSSTTTTVGSGTITATGVLTIDSGHTLDAGAKTWVLSGSGTPFSNSGNFTASTSTVQYTGTTATNITAATYYDLEARPAANSITQTFAAGTTAVSNSFTAGNGTNTGVIVTANTNSTILDIGSVTISANTTLQAHASNSFTVAGNWTNNGTFTHNSGTVTLDGAAQQTLSGTMTTSPFNNLIITNASVANPDVIFAAAATTAATFTAATAGTQIQFLAGADFTFQNIVFNGQATGTRVTLTSSTTSAWNIIVAGTRSVLNTSVSYSTASASYANIDATDSSNFDAENNTRWNFPLPSVTISGTAYTNETGTTLNSSGGTITLVNGTTGATASDADGTDGSGVWSITGVTAPTNGDVLTIWINGATADGTLVLKYGASCTGTPSCTGLSIYQNKVILRDENTSSIANADLGNCDNDSGTNCGDTEIGFTSNTNVLTVSSGLELHVWTGDTLDPNGTVTTNATGGDLHVDDSAIAYLDTATSTIGRDALVDASATLHIDADTAINGGDITTGNSATVDYSTGTPTLTISGTGSIGGGTTPTITFYNLTTSGTGTTTIASTATVANDFTAGSSTTVNGSASFGVGRSLIGDGTVNMSGGTVTLTSSNGSIGGNTAWTFNNLTLDYTGACSASYILQATGSGQMTINGAFSANETCNCGAECTHYFRLSPGAKTWILASSGTGNTFILANNGDTSTFRYTGSSNTTVSYSTYYNLELLPASGTPTYDISTGFVIFGTVLTFSSSLADLTEGTSIIYINHSATITGGGQTIYSLDMAGATSSIALSTSDLTVSGLFRLGISTLTINSGRQLTWKGTQANFLGTVTGAGTFVVDTATTLPTGGTLSSLVRFDTSAGSTTIIPARTYGGAVEVYNNNASARTLTGPASGTMNFSNNLATTCSACGGLVLDLDDTTDATYNITGNLTIGASTTVQAPSSTTLSVGTNFANSGTFTHNSGTVALTTSTAATISGSSTFNNLNIIPGASTAKTVTFTAGTTQTISGTWTVTGTSGYLVTLQSSSSPTQWNVNPTAASVSYVQVSDSNNQGTIICATYSTDTGDNNVNWTVSPNANCQFVSGSVLGTNESSFIGNPPCDGSTQAVSLRINGGTEATTTCANTTGNYSFVGLAFNAGDTITVYLNGNSTPKANLIIVGGSSGSSSANLYQNRVIFRDDQDGIVNIPDTWDYDNTQDSANMLFDAVDAATDTLTTESSVELHVWTGDTFDPGGTVTTNATGGDLHVDDSAIAYLDTATSTIGRDALVDASATLHIDADTAINGGDITTGNSATVDYSTGTPTLTISGTGSIGGGTAPAITFYNLTTSGTGTTTIASTTAVNRNINISGGTLTVNAALEVGDHVVDVEGDITVTGTLNGNSDITVNGGDLTGAGTVTMTGGTVTVYFQGVIGSSGANNWTFNNLTFSIGATGCTLDYTTTTAAGSGSMTINGTLTTQQCTCGETCSYQHTLDAGAKTWILNGAVATPFVNGGDFVGNTSTVRYTGVNPSGNVTVAAMNGSSVDYYYNLQIQPPSAETYEFSAQQNYYIGNDLYVNSDATVSAYSGNYGAAIIMDGTAGSIDANGETFYDINIDPATAGTITIKNTDLTAYHGLTVAVSDALTINNGINVTYNGALIAPAFTLNGTINGPGRLIYTASAAFPAGGTLANSLITRFDATSTAQTMSARADYQKVEIYNTGSTDRIVTAAAGTITIASTLDLAVTSTGKATLDTNTNDPTMTVTGNVTIGTDTIFLASSANTLSLGASFANSGTFTHNSGTVALTTSTAAVISGNTTFNNLTTTSIGAAKTITFTAGSTQTVAGTWTVAGAAGQIVTLQSSSSPTQWNINPAAASVSYVQVSNSHNQGVSFCATYATDTGDNNTGWNIEAGGSCGVTISGHIYSDKGSTAYNCASNNLTIGTSVHAAATKTGTCTAADGSYSVEADYPTTAGDQVVVFIDSSETPQATTITLSADTVTDIANVDLYDGYVIAKYENAGPINAADLSSGDNGDAGIRYEVLCGGSCFISLSNLYIPTGITMNVDTDIHATSIDIVGTIQGTYDLEINGGDLTGAGTVNMTGSAVTFGIGNSNIGGSSNDWTFNNLTFSYPDTCVAGDSSYDTVATGAGDFTVSGALTTENCSCGEGCTRKHAFSADSKTIILTGSGDPLVGTSLDYDTSTFRYTYGGAVTTDVTGTYYNLELDPASGTPTYDSAQFHIYGNLFIDPNISLTGFADTTMYGTSNTIDAGDKTFRDLTIDPASTGTITVQNTDLTASRTLTVAAGDTLSISSSRTVSHTGAYIFFNGAISGAGTMRFTDTSCGPGTSGTLSSITRYDATGGDVLNTTFDARTYGGSVEAYANTAATRSIAMATGTQQVNGSFSVITGASQSQVLTMDASANPTVNITGDLAYTKGGSATPAITSGTGIWTVSGNVNFTNGTYTATAGNTMKMNGTGKTITSASQTLQNYEVSGGSVSSADAMDVNATFKVTSGQFTQHATSNLNVADDFTLENGTTFTYSATSGLLILDGDLIFNDKNTTKQNMGDVQVGTSPDTTDLASDMKANKLTVTSADIFNSHGFDLDIGSKGVDVSGTFNATDDNEADTIINTEGDFSLNSGATFTPSDSKIIFDGTSGTDNLITDGSFSLYDLEINDAGGSLTVEVEDPLDVNNNLTITNGTLDTVSTENNAINVGNNWLNGDTFTARAGTVTFDATSTGHTINPGSSAFYDLAFNGSGGAWSPLTNTVTVTNDLTMTNGTFNTATGTANVTVNGNVQCGVSCGTISMTSTNTFTQSASASKNFGANAGAGTNWSFYNLTFGSSSGTPTITLNSAGTGQISVTHDLSLTNSGTSLTVDNETNDRILPVTGAVTIASGATLQASSTASFTVGGNWTNNGDFTAGTGTVTLDGTGQQNLSGQMTGSSDRFYNLIVTNAGASNPDVIFSNSAETQNNFTAATASTQLQFNATSTYTFQNISFNGQASGTRVSLRSSSPSTQWNMNVAGTRSVLNTDAQDSNACGQQPYIDATGGTNLNSGRNSCWLFFGLSVSLSPTTINLGELSTSQIKQSGVSLTVSTDAFSGYAAMAYYDGQLRTATGDNFSNASGGTIATGSEEFGVSTSDSGQAIAQWNPAACANTASESNASALAASPQTFASATTTATNEQTTLCFLGSISPTTKAGAYATTVTIVVTGLY